MLGIDFTSKSLLATAFLQWIPCIVNFQKKELYHYKRGHEILMMKTTGKSKVNWLRYQRIISEKISMFTFICRQLQTI